MAIDQVATADGTVRAIFTSQIDDADRHARQFTDGQRAQATSVGDAFAEFMAAARSSIQDAIYNFRLDGAAATKVVGALNRAAQNDIDVRAAQNDIDVRIVFSESPSQPTPAAFTLLGGDPAVVNDGVGARPCQ